MDFKFYTSLFVRRLPYFLIIFALCSAVGLTLARILPPVYRAEALLRLDPQSIPDELAGTTVAIDPTVIISGIEAEIKTRSNLIEMANEYGVYADQANSRGEVRIPSDTIVEDMRERIVIALEGGEQRRGPNQATYIRVSFDAPTGRISSGVTNEIVTEIERLNQEYRKGYANSAVAFFEAQVNDLSLELSRLDDEILAFQEANLDALPETLTFRQNQLQDYRDQLTRLSRNEAILLNQRAQVMAILEAGGLEQTPQSSTPLTAEGRELQRLRDQLQGLLATLSPTHPRVVQLEGQIEALEPRVAEAEAAAALANPGSGGGLTALQLRVSEIDSQLEFTRDDQARLRAEIGELEANIEATFANRTELRQLERAYANTQEQYNQAVAALSQAQTGRTIELENRGGGVTVVENASIPQEPDSPNRLLIAAAGVGGGLVLGLAVIVLLELLNSAIRRPVDLTKRLGITPLGTIARIRTRAEVFRRRAIIAAGFILVLGVLPASLWFVHDQVMPLDRLLSTAMSRVGLT